VGAIGLAGQLPTLVVCGTDGRALGAAVTWKDARADAWAAATIDAHARRRLYEITGMPIDGRYLGPMFHHHWRGRRDSVGVVLSAKDFLGSALTGARVTDPSTAVGYACYSLASAAFAPELCERWQLPMRTLPSVRDAHALAGYLHAEAAALLGLPAGIPVAVGAADAVAGAFALSGLATGTASVMMGSSTIVIDALTEATLDPATRYLLTPHVAPGWYAREMDLLASGTGYAWLSGLFGWAPGTLDHHAATSVPGAHGLTFTPYLAHGEQGALWNPDLRASITGLGLRHTAGDVARAFLEGINFEIRRCLDVLAETRPVDRVVLSGAMTERPASVALLADLLDRPIELSRLGSAAAAGAALGARSLAGLPPAALPSEVGRAVVLPGANRASYQRLYGEYLDATR
jgi:xylulokinase